MLTGCLLRSIGEEPPCSQKAPWAFVLAVPDINKSAQYFPTFLASVNWTLCD